MSKQMRNVLGELPFYKKKSIMIMDLAHSVEYNVVKSAVTLRFATREDEKSQGSWDKDNVFYFLNYNTIYDFASKFKAIVSGPVDGSVVINNPAKGKGVTFRKNEADIKGAKMIYIVVTFFIGTAGESTKISVSLTADEANSIISVLSSFFSNYTVTAQAALGRNDTWFNLYGEKDGGDYSSAKESQGKGKSSSGNKQPQQKPIDVDKMMEEVGVSGFSSDEVPF